MRIRHLSRLLRLLTSWRQSLGIFACASLLMACSGGGGGGENNAPPASTSVGNGFPIGVFASVPLNLINGGLRLHSDSSLVSAVASGERALAIALFNLDALFAPLAPQHASCYGPAINYLEHDDGSPGNTGTLAAGGVAMWRDLDGARPCGVAEADAALTSVTDPIQQSLLLGAALRRVVKLTGSGALPDPNTQRELTSAFTSSIAGWPSNVSVQLASVAANTDASVYTYRLALVRGAGSDLETMEISILHTPNDTSERFAGVVRITRGYLSTNAEVGCVDTLDNASGRFKVSDVRTLGYNRFDQFLSVRVRAGHYCGANLDASGDAFGTWVTTTPSGELDHTVALSGNVRASVNGWRRHLVRFSADIDLNTSTTEYLWGWQANASDTASRLFAVHVGTDTSGTYARLFHAFGDSLIDTEGALLGMHCNWNGPNPSGTLTTAFQRQVMTLNGGSWQLQQSDIAYGPTNNCQASPAMSYDTTGHGTMSTGTGAGSDRLARPTNGRTDVQAEIVEQGFWMPLLF